jgi:protein associated with RNAse G/E
VWVSWLPDGDHYGWYVNLQRPFRRTSIGIEAMDMMLDVVAEPDLSWRWKDDDEFDQIVQRGIFDAATAVLVRNEARRVIEHIEQRAAPFDHDWPSWRPDPSWPQPELSNGWDDPSL